MCLKCFVLASTYCTFGYFCRLQIFCISSHTCLVTWTSLSTQATSVGKSESANITYTNMECSLFYIQKHIICVNSSNCKFCRNQRARPIIIDPGFYHSKKSGVFWAKERRSLPASFKLFMGTKKNTSSHSLFILIRSVWFFSNRVNKCSSNKTVPRVLHLGMGQPPKNAINVLHQLPSVIRRLFSDSCVQQQRLSEHNC